MRGTDGWVLAEVLVAVAVLGVGVVGVLAGLTQAVQGVEGARQESTAVFLAEARLESLRAGTYDSLPAGAVGDEGYGAIPTAPGFRRSVSVAERDTASGPVKVVTVRVAWRPVVGWGVLAAEREVALVTAIGPRR
jgi:Tfp pilus assembly protein PilV